MLRYVALLGAILCASPAFSWGAVGHRVTGALADQGLSGVARANVQILLGSEDLAEAATWPDEMRSDPDPYWKKTDQCHWVTVPVGVAYKAEDAPFGGDSPTALAHFTDTLRNAHASLDERRRALRFIVHLIGDLHQPLHVGIKDDQGGNAVKVTLFGRPTNLHSVWDSGLIEQRRLSYSEYAAWLSRAITPQEIVAWSDRNPATWIAESIALEKSIYPEDPDLGWDYQYRHIGEIDKRLKQAGLRIAAYLNWVFDGTRGDATAPPSAAKK